MLNLWPRITAAFPPPVCAKRSLLLCGTMLGRHGAGNELCRLLPADPAQVQCHSFKSHLPAVPGSVLLTLPSHTFCNIVCLNSNSLMPETTGGRWQRQMTGWSWRGKQTLLSEQKEGLGSKLPTPSILTKAPWSPLARESQQCP